jgi:hypothetical protein
MRDKLAKAATEADYRVYEKEQEVRGDGRGEVGRKWQVMLKTTLCCGWCR